MKRVRIFKNGAHVAGADMEDPAIWISEQKALNSWGKPERWVTERDEDVSGALETREVEVLGALVKEYRLPAEYTIEIEDITAEIEEKERAKRQEKLDEGIRKEAKSAIMSFNLNKVQDPELRAWMTNVTILISKWK